jgi:predicted O-methyltransferase YrrM
MNPQVLRVIERLEKEDTEDRETHATRPPDWGYSTTEVQGLWALHPDTARLTHMLVQAAGYKSLVEIGVCHGYSTVWLAHAATITGGRLTSLEINPKSIEIARPNLTEAGLLDTVEFVVGDASETLRTLQAPIDFVLMDCFEELYIDFFTLIVPLLRPGGLLLADNATPGHPPADAYMQVVREDPRMETVSMPIGRDLEVSVKRLDAIG